VPPSTCKAPDNFGPSGSSRAGKSRSARARRDARVGIASKRELAPSEMGERPSDRVGGEYRKALFCQINLDGSLRVMLGAAALVAMLVFIGALGWANWPAERLGEGVKADLVVVRKCARVLELYAQDSLLKSYRVSLGGDPIGPKRAEGDGRTPEGAYVLDYRKSDSSFHRALHISYPSETDAVLARASGLDPGGLIMVHGLPNGLGLLGRLHRLVDWTDGCVAVTNPEIEEIWAAVADGTQIKIER